MCQLSLSVNFALCSIITCSIGVSFYAVVRVSCLFCLLRGICKPHWLFSFPEDCCTGKAFLCFIKEKKSFYYATCPTTEVVVSLGQHEALLNMLSYLFYFQFCKNMDGICACHLSEVGKGTKGLQAGECAQWRQLLWNLEGCNFSKGVKLFYLQPHLQLLDFLKNVTTNLVCNFDLLWFYDYCYSCYCYCYMNSLCSLQNFLTVQVDFCV